MSSINPTIEQRKKELEILQQEERRLMERLKMYDTTNTNNDKNDSRKKQNTKAIKNINKQHQNGGSNDFESFFYRETSTNSENFNKYLNSKQENPNRKEEKATVTNSDDDCEGSPHARPANQSKVQLIDICDDDDADSEIMRVFSTGHEQNDVFTGLDDLQDIEEETTEQLDRAQIDGMQLLSSSFNETFDDCYNQSDDDKKYMQHQKVSMDIAETLLRERELQYERGSNENVYDYNYDSEEDRGDVQYEDTREKILREIEESKLREMELQQKYQNQGVSRYDEYDDYGEDKQMGSAIEVDIHKSLTKNQFAFEIRQLRDQERLNYESNVDSDDSQTNEQQNEYIDPRERIEREIRSQQAREIEINILHRSLSKDDLLVINNDDDIDENEAGDKVDARVKILREMEESKRLDKEIKSEYPITEYDIINANEAINDVINGEVNGVVTERNHIRDRIYEEMEELQIREEELKKAYSRRFNAIQSFEEITIDDDESLKNEFVPKSLRDTDKKKFGSREDLVAFFGTSNIDEKKMSEVKPKPIDIPSAFTEKIVDQMNAQERKSTNPFRKSATDEYEYQNLLQTNHPAFNIFDDYHKKHDQNKEITLSITDQLSDISLNSQDTGSYYSNYGNSSHSGNRDNGSYNGDVSGGDVVFDQTDSYFYDEMKRVKTSKKKIVFRRKSLQNTTLPTKGFASNDVKKEEKQKEKKVNMVNRKKRINIHPIAAKWEQRGQEEKRRKQELETEMQRKKEQRAKYLAEKAEHERHLKLIEEEKLRRTKQREEERKLLKIKQQELNDLWTSKYSTNNHNPDRNRVDNENIDRNDQKQTRKTQTTIKIENKTASTTNSNKDYAATQPSISQVLEVTSKIKKWERKIAKTSS